MLKATKVRVYPTPKQQADLAKAFGCARWLYNNQLLETQKQYKDTGKGLSQFDMNKRIPALKKEFPWLAETHSQVLQAVSLNLTRAFTNFFEKRAGFPKLKFKHNEQSIQYPQGVKIKSIFCSGKQEIEDCSYKLFIPKIGLINARFHREIVGTIKTVTISKTKTNKYFASILTETNEQEPTPSYIGKILGIDLGLTHLVITSNGDKFDNQKHLRKAEHKLAKSQRQLSKKKKGSKNRNKARLKVAKCHERIANQRKDNLHKISTKLVNENQVIAVENLAIKNMVKNHKLAKSISDAGWGMFKSFLSYKCKRQGKGFVEVDRYFPSSKTCSNCQHVQKLSLNDRTWVCHACKTEHDRDINAARNIRDEALKIITAGSAVPAYGGTISQNKKLSCSARAVEVGSP